MEPMSIITGITITISHMALGKSLNLSKPQFPYLKNKEDMHENALPRAIEIQWKLISQTALISNNSLLNLTTLSC